MFEALAAAGITGLRLFNEVLLAMPFLHIRTCNSDFECVDDGAQYERAEDALTLGIESAVSIVKDEVQQGRRTAAVEICVESESGEKVLRSVVAISVSALTIAAPSSQCDA